MCLEGMLLSLRRRPEALNPRRWAMGGLVVGGSAAALRLGRAGRAGGLR
jgi:hypothetical protein